VWALLCSGGELAWILGVGTMLGGIRSEILVSICPWGHFYDTKCCGNGLHGSDSILEFRGHTSSSMANGHGVLARSLAGYMIGLPTSQRRSQSPRIFQRFATIALIWWAQYLFGKGRQRKIRDFAELTVPRWYFWYQLGPTSANLTIFAFVEALGHSCSSSWLAAGANEEMK